MPRWQDYTFEDRVASYILAVLYSSQHVDVTVNLEDVKTGLAAATRTILEGMRERGSEEGAVTARESREKLKEEKALLKEFQDRSRIASEEFERAKRPGESRYPLPPDISLLFRRGDHGPGGAPQWVEESHFDTVATAVVGQTMYVACNYKTRVPLRVKYEPAFRYVGFGFPREKLDDLYRALTREFMEVRFPRITRLVFLRGRPLEGPAEMTPDVAEAIPHAEMQLVSYLRHIGKPEWIGVSKPCCAGCARVLRGIGIGYLQEVAEDFSHWAPPEQIAVEVLREYHVCLLVLRLRGG